MYRIDYEQTDKKIIVDIYGLEFEVKKLKPELLNEIKDLKEENIEKFEELYKYIDLFLGEGAIDKINAKRKQDGYDEMDYKVIIAIIDLVLDVYIKNYEQVMSYKNKFNNNRYNRRKRY